MGAGVADIGMTLTEGEIQSSAIRQKTRFEVMQAETNAKLAEFQERDILKRGEKAANSVKRAAKRAKSSARAALAASGVDIDLGSAAEAQADIELAGELDAIQIQNNAYREAFGFKMEASQQRFMGTMAQISGDFQASTTLLGSQAGAFAGGLKLANNAMDKATKAYTGGLG